MRILVVGKSRRVGTSKTGKDYDFTTIMSECDMIANDDNAGVSVHRINVGATMIDYALVEVGATYDLDYDPNGYLLGIEKL
nr:MAG TPA: RstB-like protein [Inoviridae sp.]